MKYLQDKIKKINVHYYLCVHIPFLEYRFLYLKKHPIKQCNTAVVSYNEWAASFLYLVHLL